MAVGRSALDHCTLSRDNHKSNWSNGGGNHNRSMGGEHHAMAMNDATQQVISTHEKHRQRKLRLGRILAVFLIFSSSSLFKLNQHSFLMGSFMYLLDNNDSDGQPGNNTNSTISIRSETLHVVHEREWDRMLFGIFTYDSPNEADVRAACRETHLSYYKNSPQEKRRDVICSLKEILANATLAQDPESCRVVYTFVLGGGIGNHTMRQKVTKLEKKRETVAGVKARCLWEDPECGGTDITKWTLDAPKCNVSQVLAHELNIYHDMTLLSIPENHELGKTDTWFTYMAMLTRQRPDLQIGFVGKIDSDNLIRWPHFFGYLKDFEEEIKTTKPFSYGGYAIHKNVCKGRVYGGVCNQPNVIFERFASGAIVYLSTLLAQHVFMDGTTLERKREVWMVGEDMQLGNMAYSDPNINPFVINHRYGRGGQYISTHMFNDANNFRREYFQIYPDQKKTFTSHVIRLH